MDELDQTIGRIREFNRFYTNIIGVLDKHILNSAYSLSEARVLYEIRHMPDCTARKIMHAINMDEGYLSRIVDNFIRQVLVKKTRSEQDGRAYILTLTPKGKAQFEKINTASMESVKDILQDISENDRRKLLTMMDGIQNILSRKYEE